jgi:hypothetical protein
MAELSPMRRQTLFPGGNEGNGRSGARFLPYKESRNDQGGWDDGLD